MMTLWLLPNLTGFKRLCEPKHACNTISSTSYAS